LKILVDTNVILDALLEREPFVDPAVGVLDSIESKEVKGYLAGTTVTTIFYLTQRATTEKKARKIIENLLTLFDVASIGQKTLTSALTNEFKDYEDGVIHEAALEIKADAIITRNIKDFKKSKCPVLSPMEFLASQ
jgi:predicted nucleic acid-binding protein